MTTVRPAAPEDVETCVDIVRELPEHFTPEVPAKVQGDLQRHGGWVAERNGRIVGFVVISRRAERAAEVLCAGVEPAIRRRGVGTRLLTDVLHELRANGVRVVEVKTLDASVDYPPYEAIGRSGSGWGLSRWTRSIRSQDGIRETPRRSTSRLLVRRFSRRIAYARPVAESAEPAQRGRGPAVVVRGSMWPLSA
jgi:N-acetylglutamate synthase-like GNAT family acetyltransferase